MSVNPSTELEVFCTPAERIFNIDPRQINACKWNIQSNSKVISGSIGSTYQTCCKENCNYIAKHIKIQKKFDYVTEKYIDIYTFQDIQKFQDEVMSEVQIQRYAFDIGVGLQIFDAWFCADFKSSTFVMEKADITLTDLISEHKGDKYFLSPIIMQAISQIEKLNADEIIHGDLHTGNIMLIRRTGRVVIIDYGYSKIGQVEYPEVLFFLEAYIQEVLLNSDLVKLKDKYPITLQDIKDYNAVTFPRSYFSHLLSK